MQTLAPAVVALLVAARTLLLGDPLLSLAAALCAVQLDQLTRQAAANHLAALAPAALDLEGLEAAALIGQVLGEPEAEAFDAREIAADLAELREVLGRGAPEGPGEVVANDLAALAHLVTSAEACAARGEAARPEALARLAELEAIWARTAATLTDWRTAVGCLDWAAVRAVTAEVQACQECHLDLLDLKERMLGLAAGLDGTVYRRLTLRAA